MKLKEGELRIHYFGGGKDKMEDELMRVLKSYGYHRWASGFAIEDRVRDLAFEKKG